MHINSDETQKTVIDSLGFDTDNLVGVDEFGRNFTISQKAEKSRDVGMFYWIWQGQHVESMTGNYDISKLLVEHPDDIFDKEGTSFSPLNNFHFWGEPKFGYYHAEDEYIIRRHIEMLTLADIDFIVFDTTNAVIYSKVWMKMLEILDEYQKQGWNVPKIAFYTNSSSKTVMEALYKELYGNMLFPNLWYCPVDNKPLIIGVKSDFLQFDEEIQNAFYFRSSQWPTDDIIREDGFSWLDWVRPQRVYDNMMNVSVAQHPSVPFSDSILFDVVNWGRGYTSKTPLNGDITAIRHGDNFQEQWDNAHENDPDIVFITGWNEWISIKQMYTDFHGTRIMFCDNYNEEYSRDIEPMNGGYNDAFYLQLIKNVRKYKKSDAKISKKPQKTIDINLGKEQWKDVTAIYRSIGNNAYGRDSIDFCGKNKFFLPETRNKINQVRITHDSSDIFMMIQTQKDISKYDGTSKWMNIFVGVGEISLQGWQSYTHLINAKPQSNGQTSVETLNENFERFESGNALYAIQNNVMQIKIPKKSLGINEDSFSFYYKIADNVSNQSDIMDYYVTGESFPLGRLSYNYHS